MHTLSRGLLTLSLCLMAAAFCSCPPQDIPPFKVWSIDGIDFVYVPANTFMMGAPANETDGFDWERPVHQVQLKHGFYMSQKEITQEQWHRIVGADIVYTMQDTLSEDLPMRRVSWFDAQTFIAALQARNTASVFRLPTEAEWESAARAGTTTRFFWGDDPTLANSDAFAWTDQNSELDVHYVGLLAPNHWGLLDISGNVVEWVQDRYHENYVSAPADGSAWGTPERTEQDDPFETIYGVVRGGCYNWSPADARSAFRYSETPDSRRPYTGFRVVMEE